jgi:putative heme-binding domain-containing protein
MPTVFLLLVLSTSTALAQAPAAKNPRAGDPNAIRAGLARFQLSCAECHGIDAKGVFGPDLTTLWAAGVSEERIFDIVRRGIQGSSMPASRMPDDEIWAVLAYLRTLAPSVPLPPPIGDAQHGEQLFWARCGSCHRVGSRGGYLGPDLSRIGSSRSRETLIRDIRNASASIVPGYRPVTLVAADGRRIRGVARNEDAFSIQVMDTRDQLRGYLKSTLREIVDEPRSLMPDFGPDQLSERDLDDIVRFLGTLGRADPGRR